MAYKKGYKFHGNHYNTPGVYSYAISEMRAQKADGALNIALIGESKGGIPGKIAFIDDYDIAKDVLKGGDLLKACEKAYDPVKYTRAGIELGGADLIFAIRANNATKAVTNIYQPKDTDAVIGEVVTSKHEASTGSVTAKGVYTGKENTTYKIVITSEGTKPLKEATYNFKIASEDSYVTVDDLKLSEAANATDKLLGEGVTVTFADGNYTKGDSFLIPCIAKTTKSEFIVKLESKDYGEECNLISHKMDDSDIEGLKTFTIYDGKRDEYEVYTNIGGTFSIKYTGTAKYAALSIVSDGKGNSIKLQTLVGTSESECNVDLDIELDETQFKSIKALCEYVGSFENYETDMIPTCNPELAVNDLDFLDRVNIMTTKQITAVLRDLQKSLKFQSELLEVEILNREVSKFDNYPFTNLVGGEEGRVASSFVKYLDLLAPYDIDYVVVLTDDLSIIAEAREHCIAMSEKQGKERRLVCGTGNYLKAGQAVQNAKRLSHPRVQYVGTGFYDYDENRKVKLYPAYIAAAMHAGRAAFLKEQSATADIYNMIEPEFTFEGRDRKNMIDNGVIFFDQVVSDYDYKQFYSKLVWDYTTFLEYDDPLLVERSTGAIADKLSKKIRKELDRIFTGRLSPTGTLESMKNCVLSVLKRAIKEGLIVEYKDVIVKKHRDKTNITFGVAPSQVNNFTFVDITFYDKDLER